MTNKLLNSFVTRCTDTGHFRRICRQNLFSNPIIMPCTDHMQGSVRKTLGREEYAIISTLLSKKYKTMEINHEGIDMNRPEMCFHLSATARVRRRRVRKSFHLRIQPRPVDLCNEIRTNNTGSHNMWRKSKEIGSPSDGYDKGARSTRVTHHLSTEGQCPK